MACGRTCCDFDINVSLNIQKKHLLQLDALEFAHMFSVKLCGHHEEGALMNLSKFMIEKKTMFSKICQNWRSLVARRREGQSLAAPRRPPALSGVHSLDDPFTDPNPAEKLQHKLSRLCFKQLLIETLRSPPHLPTMVYSNPPRLMFATLVRVMMQNPAENI